MARVLATVKINARPGEKYIFRERSSAKQPIQEIFSRISERIQGASSNENNIPFQGELLLGHVRIWAHLEKITLKVYILF
jgi:amidophosphoribosyltransferase